MCFIYARLFCFVLPKVAECYRFICRYWEELRESVEQLEGQLQESSSAQHRFNTSLEEVRLNKDFCLFLSNLGRTSRITTSYTSPLEPMKITLRSVRGNDECENQWLSELCYLKAKTTLGDLHKKLDHPVTSCTSSSETYKCLQNHMVCLSLWFRHYGVLTTTYLITCLGYFIFLISCQT